MPKTTVSKRVAELEAGLGARLIHRTSRSFTLTEVGRDFYDHARAALIEAESAEGLAQRVVPVGRLHVGKRGLDRQRRLDVPHGLREVALRLRDRFDVEQKTGDGSSRRRQTFKDEA